MTTANSAQPSPSASNGVFSLAALKRDVRLLGRLLGEVLRRREGETVFQCIEKARELSKRGRAGDTAALGELSTLLHSLSAPQALSVARGFSVFLSLANVAESHHRLHTGPRPTLTACEETLRTLADERVTEKRLQEVFGQIEIEIVLTAHPTQVVRRSLLQRYNAISSILRRRDQGRLDPAELEERLRRELLVIWDTDEVIRERPSPVDEARSGLGVLEQELWVAVPAFLRQLDRLSVRHTGQALGPHHAPIRFGSWMGGDRDGNPNVTAPTTAHVAWMGRRTACELFARDIARLASELPMNRCSDELRQRVGEAQEPYRAFLAQVIERLHYTRRRMQSLIDGETPTTRPHYDTPTELAADLDLCARSLMDSSQEEVARGRLLDIQRRLACFGLNMARLDIRQESERHTELLDAITRHLELGSYAEWSEDERLAFLERELESRRPLLPERLPLPDTAQEVLDTFRIARDLGEDSLGAYVISMTRSASDILAVSLLQKAVGNAAPQRVVPLFETIDDLKHAGEIMRRLFGVKWYRSHIGDRHEVMIGYSDSAKDGGRLAANWALYQAQEEIVAVCKEHGVRPTLFHGRGGTVARGGGPTHLAVQSQPPGSVDGRLRVTEQGEMIQMKFGTRAAAISTLETYFAATLHATLSPPPSPLDEWRQIASGLAEASMRHYRRTVREQPRFVEYFRLATPEQELGSLNIGSRPARRRATGGIESLRAIPWIFAWTQNRLCLPSWLGVGHALDDAAERGRLDRLQRLHEQWPFFRAMISLFEMVLSKADTYAAEAYDDGLVPEDLHPLGAALRQQLEMTERRVLEVSQHAALLADDDELGRILAARRPYMDPLNVLQIELLRRLRDVPDGVEAPGEIWDAFVTTVNGIAAGMRNTG